MHIFIKDYHNKEVNFHIKKLSPKPQSKQVDCQIRKSTPKKWRTLILIYKPWHRVRVCFPHPSKMSYNTYDARLTRSRWYGTTARGIPEGPIKKQVALYRRQTETNFRTAEEELEKLREEVIALRAEVARLKQVPSTPPPPPPPSMCAE